MEEGGHNQYNTRVTNAFLAHRERYFKAEAYCFSNLLGSSAQSELTLDLGCGGGNYTRYLRHCGAAHVLGIDLSQGMIDMAKREEETNPIGGITYLNADIAALDSLVINLPSPFDNREEELRFAVVSAAFVLQHFSSIEEIVKMLKIIWRYLKPGGKLIAGVNNPPTNPSYNESLKRYGLYYDKYDYDNLHDGLGLSVCFVGDDGLVSEAIDYFYTNEAYEKALKDAGFVDIIFKVPSEPHPSASIEEKEYLKEYLEWPNARFFCAIKPAEK